MILVHQKPRRDRLSYIFPEIPVDDVTLLSGEYVGVSAVSVHVLSVLCYEISK